MDELNKDIVAEGEDQATDAPATEEATTEATEATEAPTEGGEVAAE